LSWLIVPHWLLALLTAALSLALMAPDILAYRGRRRRIAADRCITCAYDLTGNVTARCPESGSEIAQPTGRPSSSTTT
jgi:hypothetical protein